MKNFNIVAFSLFASAQISCAGLFDDMFGKWKVNEVEPGSRVTTVFKPLGSKGMIANTTVVIPGLANSTAVTRYHANGTFRGTASVGGVARSTTIGTWRVRGNKLIEKGKVSSPLFPTINHNVTATLIAPNRIATVSVLDGERRNGSLTRLR